MAMHVSLLPQSLDLLSSKLTQDPDIRTNVGQISTKVKDCVTSYKNMITTEGNTAIVLKQELANAARSNDVDVQKMESCLVAITGKLTGIRNQVVAMQGDVHSSIETCRSRKKKHEADIDTKSSSITVLEGEIRNADSEITTLDSQIGDFDRAAVELDNRAGEIDRARRKKRKRGKWGIVGSIAGVALAPFTGGASLALTAVGAVTATVDLHDADDCRRKAGGLRSDAQAKRQEAADMRSKRSTLETRKTTANSEIASLRSANANLDEATRNLQEMTNGLATFVSDIDNVIAVFQNMETSFKECKLQTDSFRIIQNAFKKHPDRLTGREQTYLDQLKSKWNAMEAMLVQNGATAISN